MIRIMKRKNVCRIEYVMMEREGIDINMNKLGSAREQIENKSNKCLNASILENIESNVFHK